MNSPRLLAAVLVWFATCSATSLPAQETSSDIRPWRENPRFWEYHGKPILLVGGSDDDNLFQRPDLEKQLEIMARVGANYIRNTMSDRRDRGFEVYPFRRLASGKYDLTQWNEEYWERFERMLRMTAERNILVQIEVWDRFDYSDAKGPRWREHPYNPANNVNYSHEEAGLAAEYLKHPGRNEQPFFYSVPGLRNNTVLLPFQRAQVDKMLSHSLRYGHVLYCIDNETSGAEEWGAYWAKHIRKKAEAVGKEVHVTEMWDAWKPQDPTHRRTFDHPDLYTFVDISQNNHNSGEAHWRNLQWVLEYLAPQPRPLNTVKIYGADGGRFGNTRDGLERFWRNLLGGVAGTRFHRPDSGIGLSPRAQRHVQAFRMLQREFDFFSAQPDVEQTLLMDREENEAYLSVVPDRQYAVYFPNGGEVRLHAEGLEGVWRARWLDIEAEEWTPAKQPNDESPFSLRCPGDGHFVCLLTRAK